MEPGYLVTPSVRLKRELGAGGMGSVWVADHLALQTEVVVKFMSAALSFDASSAERFSREAVAAAQVKSPHVVQTFDHGVAPDGSLFIVMELLEGEDLAHRLKNGPLPPPLVASLLTQVCLALARAHAAGVVHRDIKPDNIFLCDVGGDEPFVKLLDFGIAKATHSPSLVAQTQTGAMMGTPHYMSPEQFLGSKDIDFRTDLWSLGVVAFECITGAKPFNGETMGGLVIAVNTGEIPLPSSRRPSARALDPWFQKACARDPAARFQSAKEFSEALTRCVESADASETQAIGVGTMLLATSPVKQLLTTGAAGSLGVPALSVPISARSSARVRWSLVAAGLLALVAGALWLRHPSEPSHAADSALPPTGPALPSTSQAASASAVPTASASAVPAESVTPSGAAAASPPTPSAAVSSKTPSRRPRQPGTDPFQPKVF